VVFKTRLRRRDTVEIIGHNQIVHIYNIFTELIMLDFIKLRGLTHSVWHEKLLVSVNVIIIKPQVINLLNIWNCYVNL